MPALPHARWLVRDAPPARGIHTSKLTRRCMLHAALCIARLHCSVCYLLRVSPCHLLLPNFSSVLMPPALVRLLLQIVVLICYDAGLHCRHVGRVRDAAFGAGTMRPIWTDQYGR